jgi:putative inorganic carbon (HCO3(-)) transporter
MTAEVLARLAGPVGAGGLALLFVGAWRWARLLGLAAALVGMGLLVPLLLPSGGRILLVGGGIATAALAAGLGVLFQRHPWALPLFALAAVPARIPITVGGDTNNLLLPLYALIAGAAVSLGWSLWREVPARRRELGALAWPLAAFVAWVGLSLAWTNDPERGAAELLAFYLPFGLLAVALVRLNWSGDGVVWLFRLLLALGLLFAAVGIWQWATRSVFWNPKVIADNAFATFYRVNSLFWDPSIYGRFLVVAILVTLTVLVFGPWRRWDWYLCFAIAVLWAGLLFSFSQSSFAALIAGVAVAGLLGWRRRGPAVAAAAAVLLTGLGTAVWQPLATGHALAAGEEQGLNRATRGRFELVKNGLEIALDHPVVGVGVGGFTKTYRQRVDVAPWVKTPASHNTPVTVAAEEGIVGLGLFTWLLVAAFVVLFRRIGPDPPLVSVAGRAAALALTAIFVHSLFYAALFEDPLTWGFLALALLAVRESAARASEQPQSSAGRN